MPPPQLSPSAYLAQHQRRVISLTQQQQNPSTSFHTSGLDNSTTAGDCPGSRGLAFAITEEHYQLDDRSKQDNYQCISRHPAYQKWSAEELRVADYTAQSIKAFNRAPPTAPRAMLQRKAPILFGQPSGTSSAFTFQSSVQQNTRPFPGVETSAPRFPSLASSQQAETRPEGPSSIVIKPSSSQNRLGHNAQALEKATTPAPSNTPLTVEPDSTHHDIHSAMLELSTIKLSDCRDVAAFGLKLLNLNSALCDIHESNAMPESFLISCFLAGLGKEYAHWREKLAQTMVLVARSAEDVAKVARFETVMVAAMAQEQKVNSRRFEKSALPAKVTTTASQDTANPTSYSTTSPSQTASTASILDQRSKSSTLKSAARLSSDQTTASGVAPSFSARGITSPIVYKNNMSLFTAPATGIPGAQAQKILRLFGDKIHEEAEPSSRAAPPPKPLGSRHIRALSNSGIARQSQSLESVQSGPAGRIVIDFDSEPEEVNIVPRTRQQTYSLAPSEMRAMMDREDHVDEAAAFQRQREQDFQDAAMEPEHVDSIPDGITSATRSGAGTGSAVLQNSVDAIGVNKRQHGLRTNSNVPIQGLLDDISTTGSSVDKIHQNTPLKVDGMQHENTAVSKVPHQDLAAHTARNSDGDDGCRRHGDTPAFHDDDECWERFPEKRPSGFKGMKRTPVLIIANPENTITSAMIKTLFNGFGKLVIVMDDITKTASVRFNNSQDAVLAATSRKTAELAGKPVQMFYGKPTAHQGPSNDVIMLPRVFMTSSGSESTPRPIKREPYSANDLLIPTVPTLPVKQEKSTPTASSSVNAARSGPLHNEDDRPTNHDLNAHKVTQTASLANDLGVNTRANPHDNLRPNRKHSYDETSVTDEQDISSTTAQHNPRPVRPAVWPPGKPWKQRNDRACSLHPGIHPRHVQHSVDYCPLLGIPTYWNTLPTTQRQARQAYWEKLKRPLKAGWNHRAIDDVIGRAQKKEYKEALRRWKVAELESCRLEDITSAKQHDANNARIPSEMSPSTIPGTSRSASTKYNLRGHPRQVGDATMDLEHSTATEGEDSFDPEDPEPDAEDTHTVTSTAIPSTTSLVRPSPPARLFPGQSANAWQNREFTPCTRKHTYKGTKPILHSAEYCYSQSSSPTWASIDEQTRHERQCYWNTWRYRLKPNWTRFAIDEIIHKCLRLDYLREFGKGALKRREHDERMAKGKAGADSGATSSTMPRALASDVSQASSSHKSSVASPDPDRILSKQILGQTPASWRGRQFTRCPREHVGAEGPIMHSEDYCYHVRTPPNWDSLDARNKILRQDYWDKIRHTDKVMPKWWGLCIDEIIFRSMQAWRNKRANVSKQRRLQADKLKEESRKRKTQEHEHDGDYVPEEDDEEPASKKSKR